MTKQEKIDNAISKSLIHKANIARYEKQISRTKKKLVNLNYEKQKEEAWLSHYEKILVGDIADDPIDEVSLEDHRKEVDLIRDKSKEHGNW